jgi:hypothetical protein
MIGRWLQHLGPPLQLEFLCASENILVGKPIISRRVDALRRVIFSAFEAL